MCVSVLRQCSASPRGTNRSAWEAADAELAVCDAVSSSKQHHRRIVLSSADRGVFVTKMVKCVRTGLCWLDLACVCPFLCARSTAVDWLAHSLRILEASGSNVGTDWRRMFWLRFLVLFLSLCTPIESHMFSLDPHRFPSAPIFLSFLSIIHHTIRPVSPPSTANVQNV